MNLKANLLAPGVSIVLSLLCVFICSCDNVDMEYSVKCPQALLEVANPVITYSFNGNAEQSITLTSSSDWKVADSGDMEWTGLGYHDDNTSANSHAFLSFKPIASSDTTSTGHWEYTFGGYAKVKDGGAESSAAPTVRGSYYKTGNTGRSIPDSLGISITVEGVDNISTNVYLNNRWSTYSSSIGTK